MREEGAALIEGRVLAIRRHSIVIEGKDGGAESYEVSMSGHESRPKGLKPGDEVSCELEGRTIVRFVQWNGESLVEEAEAVEPSAAEPVEPPRGEAGVPVESIEDTRVPPQPEPETSDEPPAQKEPEDKPRAEKVKTFGPVEIVSLRSSGDGRLIVLLYDLNTGTHHETVVSEDASILISPGMVFREMEVGNQGGVTVGKLIRRLDFHDVIPVTISLEVEHNGRRSLEPLFRQGDPPGSRPIHLPAGIIHPDYHGSKRIVIRVNIRTPSGEIIRAGEISGKISQKELSSLVGEVTSHGHLVVRAGGRVLGVVPIHEHLPAPTHDETLEVTVGQEEKPDAEITVDAGPKAPIEETPLPEKELDAQIMADADAGPGPAPAEEEDPSAVSPVPEVEEESVPPTAPPETEASDSVPVVAASSLLAKARKIAAPASEPEKPEAKEDEDPKKPDAGDEPAVPSFPPISDEILDTISNALIGIRKELRDSNKLRKEEIRLGSLHVIMRNATQLASEYIRVARMAGKDVDLAHLSEVLRHSMITMADLAYNALGKKPEPLRPDKVDEIVEGILKRLEQPDDVSSPKNVEKRENVSKAP